MTRAIQDRRRRKRILTLRNSGRAALVLLAVFIAASLFSEFRNPGPGEHGRLYNRRTVEAEVKAKPVEVVVEEKVEQDLVGADPMLMTAAAREQYLGVDTAPQFDAATTYVPTALPQLGGGSFVDETGDRVARPQSETGGRMVISNAGGQVQLSYR
jgi:hypothetical protein